MIGRSLMSTGLTGRGGIDEIELGPALLDFWREELVPFELLLFLAFASRSASLACEAS